MKTNDKFCTLLFLRHDDQILLAMKKRGFGSDRYNGVGGKIEPGESIEQAMIRECQEEIVVTPTAYGKVAELEFSMDIDAKDPWKLYVHAYTASSWTGVPVETEEMRPEWFDIRDIPYDNMWQDDETWVPMVLAGKKVVGEFEFTVDEHMVSAHAQTVDELPGSLPFKP